MNVNPLIAALGAAGQTGDSALPAATGDVPFVVPGIDPALLAPLGIGIQGNGAVAPDIAALDQAAILAAGAQSAAIAAQIAAQVSGVAQMPGEPGALPAEAGGVVVAEVTGAGPAVAVSGKPAANTAANAAPGTAPVEAPAIPAAAHAAAAARYTAIDTATAAAPVPASPETPKIAQSKTENQDLLVKASAIGESQPIEIDGDTAPAPAGVSVSDTMAGSGMPANSPAATGASIEPAAIPDVSGEMPVAETEAEAAPVALAPAALAAPPPAVTAPMPAVEDAAAVPVVLPSGMRGGAAQTAEDGAVASEGETSPRLGPRKTNGSGRARPDAQPAAQAARALATDQASGVQAKIPAGGAATEQIPVRDGVALSRSGLPVDPAPARTVEPAPAQPAFTNVLNRTVESSVLNTAPLARMATPAQPAAEQVAVQITRAAEGGNDRVTVQLKPASLGTITVEVEVGKDNKLTAVIAADRQDTLDILQRDARALERALNDAGLKTDSGSLSFNLRGEGQQRDFQNALSGHNPGSSGAGDSGEGDMIENSAPPARLVPAGGVDIRV